MSQNTSPAFEMEQYEKELDSILADVCPDVDDPLA